MSQQSKRRTYNKAYGDNQAQRRRLIKQEIESEAAAKQQLMEQKAKSKIWQSYYEALAEKVKKT